MFKPTSLLGSVSRLVGDIVIVDITPFDSDEIVELEGEAQGCTPLEGEVVLATLQSDDRWVVTIPTQDEVSSGRALTGFTVGELSAAK